ncbi:Hypothetical predicted protein [Lecanosticta acicola]|uniref:BTB domain-containing protein n=1 Tax=Lecanosticta acicola TaxID=111012 RepID=A0AAI8YY62_9PEZI|nr:Hypothetical predicted protein [Lecanosticta acicola]
MTGKERAESEEPQQGSSKVPKYLLPLLDGIKNYHKSNKHLDLVIKCQGREWKVHKTVVCPQWEACDTAITKCKEGEDNVFELKPDEKDPIAGDDPQTVDAMIHYFYNFDYGDYGNGQQDVPGIVLDIRVFLIADKYFITPLAELAVQKFEKRCKDEWSTPEFAEAASKIYEARLAPDGAMKRIIVATVKGHAKALLCREKNDEISSLANVLKMTEIGADVSSALIADDKSTKTYKCPGCNKIFSVSIPDGCKFSCPGLCYHNNRAGFWKSHVVE